MFGESVRALIATLLSAHPPIGCIIDCSSWHGRVATQNTILFQTHDGKGFTNLFEYGANTDPSSPRYGFKSNLNYQAYEYEMLAEYKFFVRGSQTAPLTRVRIRAVQPGGWTPTYYFVWQEPRQLAPPPRQVER